MGLWSMLFGEEANTEQYHKPRNVTAGLGPGAGTTTCDGCGASNGSRCKCDPEIDRKPKWWEC